MNPIRRLLINLLAPPGVAAALLSTAIFFYAWANGQPPASQSIRYYGGVLLFAYVIAIIPSSIFAAVMEWFYRHRSIAPNSTRAVWHSTAGGALAGIAIGLSSIWGGGDYDKTSLVVIAYLSLGITTGFLVAVYIKFIENREARSRSINR